MSKKDDALKLALEALEVATTPLARDRQEVLRAQAAIREALAEPDYKALYEKAAQQYNELAELMENAQGDLERVKLVQTGVGIGKPEQDYLAGVPPMLPQMRDGEKIVVAQPEQEPEFITHSVEQPYDWSKWVCPDPKGYLMKCCDCGLVHEAQFGVVRYKSENEREDCDMVDDPNLQAVFRMRRSEQWSPDDTAHRAGGLPMEQPAQQPAQQQEPVEREHITDGSPCWCEAETNYKDPETGISVIVHKEPQ